MGIYETSSNTNPVLPQKASARDASPYRMRPRGVLDCVATENDDATVDPRFKALEQSIQSRLRAAFAAAASAPASRGPAAAGSAAGK